MNLINELINSFPREKKSKRRKFTKEEDEKLKFLVEELGSKKWESISRFLPGRTGRQCRDRYQNYLTTEFFNGQWSQEEDDLLLTKYKEFGSKWSKMTCFFTKRSANALKNRWNYYLSKFYHDESENNLNNEQDDKNENDRIFENFISLNSISFLEFEELNENEEFVQIDNISNDIIKNE